jgi:glycosyltransferase involved in cell wall biosynthesis
MKVTIIMPAYNAQKFLGLTVDSVLAQTYTDWELIVVDDGSTDDTPEIVRGYMSRDRRVRLVQQANARTAAARNNGFANADPQSEFIAYLDSDDLWEKGMLESLVGVLKANPKQDGAHGLVRFIDADGVPVSNEPPTRPDPDKKAATPHLKQRLGDSRYEIIGDRVVSLPAHRPTNFSALLISSFMTPGQVVIRRSLMERVGPWDRRFLIVDDYNLWLRMAELSDFAYLEKVVIAYRIHGSNWSHRPTPLFTEFLNLLLDTLCSPKVSDQHRCETIVAVMFHFKGVLAARLLGDMGPFEVMLAKSTSFAEKFYEFATSPSSSEELVRVSTLNLRAIINELLRLSSARDLTDAHRRTVFANIKAVKGLLASFNEGRLARA